MSIGRRSNCLLIWMFTWWVGLSVFDRNMLSMPGRVVRDSAVLWTVTFRYTENRQSNTIKNIIPTLQYACVFVTLIALLSVSRDQKRTMPACNCTDRQSDEQARSEAASGADVQDHGSQTPETRWVSTQDILLLLRQSYRYKIMLPSLCVWDKLRFCAPYSHIQFHATVSVTRRYNDRSG
jgi:hypothetical protein